MQRVGGLTGAVPLSVTGLTGGMTVRWADAAPTGGTAAFTIDVDPTVPPGTYSLLVQAARAGFPPASATLELTVTPGSGVGLAIAPAGTLTLQQGQDFNVTAVITNYGVGTYHPGLSFHGSSGIQVLQQLSYGTAGTNLAVTLSIRGDAEPGRYQLGLYIFSSSLPQRDSVLVDLVIVPASPPTVTVTQDVPASILPGQSGVPLNLTLLRSIGMVGAITAAPPVCPVGVSYTITPASTTGNLLTGLASVNPGTTSGNKWCSVQLSWAGGATRSFDIRIPVGTP